MFLATTGHATTNCGIQERFQHSAETVSRCSHEVLNDFVFMHTHYVQPPLITYQTDARIKEDSKYEPYFGDFLGALHGTHIPAHVLYANRIPYQNRKGFLAQNVLAAVTFELRYCYILPGEKDLFMIVVSWLMKYKIRDLLYQKRNISWQMQDIQIRTMS